MEGLLRGLKGTRLLTGYFVSGTLTVDAAPDVAAPLPVIDLDGIADVHAVLSAPPPQGVLDHSGHEARAVAAEFSGIDLSGNSRQHAGAAGGFVTLRSVTMLRPQRPQNARPHEELMHQGIDGYE